MPETVLRPPAAAVLSAQAAAVAGALADLLDGLDEAHAAALTDAGAFLRHMAVVHGPPPPAGSGDGALDRLARALGLDDLERGLVLLAGLPDEHEGYAGVLRRLHPAGLPRPTTGLAAQLLCDGEDDRHALRAALSGGVAVTSGLLRVSRDEPVSERALELADGLWAELAACLTAPPAWAPGAPVAAGLGGWLESEPVARALRALRGDERCTVMVVADDGATATARGLALVAAAGREALAGTAAHDSDDGDRLALRALARDAVALLTLAPRAAGDAAREDSALALWHPGTLVLCARPGDAARHGERALLTVRAEPLGAGARREMWAELLPELADDAAELATRHAVEPAVAARIAADARTRAWLDTRTPERRDVAESARARSAGALPAGVTLRRPVADFDALVLQPARLAQLRAAVQRLRHQSLVLDDWGFLRDRPGARGVRMLLAGPPGTGKTLSAEVLAHTLGVDLMVVDISRILSKWIGETEQRLAEVFDAAEPGHCVLLFDEADALFGKRTDVSDAHDRYANLETAYLLQRLERFEGLAILTTNLRQNIDEAFTRRIEFVVEFDEPGVQQREALWLAHLPPGAPVAPDLDAAELAARYPVVGGLIRNAAVAAAFLAAADGTAITREHALDGLQREYEKHGRAFPGRPPDPARIHPDLSRSAR